MSDFLPESSINLNRIFSILKNAFLKPELEGEGEIRVHLENCIALISLDSDKKLIYMHAIFRFNDGARESDKFSFVNKLNQQMIVCRFYTAGNSNGALISDYCLNYEEGLVPFHVVDALKWLNGVTIAAIKQHDDKNLVA
mgnify:FL=1